MQNRPRQRTLEALYCNLYHIAQGEKRRKEQREKIATKRAAAKQQKSGQTVLF